MSSIMAIGLISYLWPSLDKAFMQVTFIPVDTLEKLEFYKLLELIKLRCSSEVSKSFVDEEVITTDFQLIKKRFRLLENWKLLSEKKEHLQLFAIEDIREDLFLLKKENYVLPVEAIFRINLVIQNQAIVQNYFNENKKVSYPDLFNICKHKYLDNSIFELVDKIFNEDGEMRDDASVDLMKISKSIRSKQHSIDHHFNSILKNYKNQGLLTDTTESYRNGRRVLSVPVEYKRKIKGIIHDESATGKTVYIEPETIIELNNDLFALFAERKREIYKIVKELCENLRPFASQLEAVFYLLIELDILQAKHSFGTSINGQIPKLTDGPILEIKDAFHPLLLVKNLKEEKETIPFDLVLLKGNRMLLISGPNAGGKTILMKAVGLLQLMIQTGIPVPVDSDSTFGIFKSICVDIGDQQSIEDDLSTYSSRLKNMKSFVDQLDEDSLLLIDEFGSGTDPKLGGAIAESLLYRFLKLKAWGVITSHYSNLKLFAYNQKGIVNGAMIFDKEKLEPTFQMRIGKPGSSFAYEIAKKVGFDHKILSYARKKIGKDNIHVEDLLSDLQDEKKRLENTVHELEQKSNSLERLIKTYEQLQRDLDVKRKRLKLEKKAQKLQEASEGNKKLEKLIRELKEKEDIEKAKQKAKEIKESKKVLINQIDTLRQEVYYRDKVKIEDFKEGDFVKMRTGSEVGQIIKIKKNKAELAIGIMRMFVPLGELVPANEPIMTRKSRSIISQIDSDNKAESSLDIRGYSYTEASRAIEEFLDKSLLTNLHEIKIIHGLGNGILRNLLWTKVKEYKDFKRIFHPEEEQGGEGVSILQF